MKYIVDLNRSGKIGADVQTKTFVEEVITTIIGGNKILGDKDYIKENNITEEELLEIAEKVSEAEMTYLDVLKEIEVNIANCHEEDFELTKEMLKFLSFDENGQLALIVLKNTIINKEEDLLKFINAEIIEENNKLYVEI